MNKFVLAALFVSVAVQAALPPYWKRNREMKAILEEQGIADIVQDNKYVGKSSRLLDGVKFVSVQYPSIEGDAGATIYEVQSGKCKLLVYAIPDLTPTPFGWAGPQKFYLTWQREMTCL